ncbi:MAG: hypothetical protein WDW38_005009 [Sanguina aurantia]
MSAVDVLLLISPEYESPLRLKEILGFARPRISTLFFVHNSDAFRLPALHALLASKFRTETVNGSQIPRGSRPYLLALAPHVTEAVAKRLSSNVTWMLPVHPAVRATDIPVCVRSDLDPSSQTDARGSAQGKQQALVAARERDCGRGGRGPGSGKGKGRSSGNACMNLTSRRKQPAGRRREFARKGFVVQGRTEAGRRNFEALWQAMTDAESRYSGGDTE